MCLLGSVTKVSFKTILLNKNVADYFVAVRQKWCFTFCVQYSSCPCRVMRSAGYSFYGELKNISVFFLTCVFFIFFLLAINRMLRNDKTKNYNNTCNIF